ncbi:MAG TPA: TonB-dependent receptor [Steroidobacter sp.]|uniref:TonB-dependent receptor n=1 Tax=Steroidobacter sp. TaxID=1978227 RepID=UPI002ED9E30D
MQKRPFPGRPGLVAALVFSSGLATQNVASAAAPAATDSEAEEIRIEEIVVTATRRELKLQDVPMSIMALGEAQLKDIGADGFADYVNLVPGLSFSQRGPGESRIIIRGVASNTGVSTVGLYMDELPVQDQGRNPEGRLFDIERIEVLRGPQGTLYGEGAMGGAIRIITNKANPSQFESETELSVADVKGGGESYGVNAMVNLPVVEDKLGVRVVGMYRDEAGYVDNVMLGRKDTNTNETQGARVTARLLATDRLTITGLVNYNKTSTGGLSGVDPVLEDLQNARPIEEPMDDSFYQYGLTLEYAFPWATLTSASSYFTRDVDFIRNAGGMARVDVQAEDEITAQELRLTSSGDGRLQWIGGLFFKEARYQQTAAFIDPSFPAMLGGPVLVEDRSASKTRQTAAFGEVSWRFTDRLEATAGVRLFREELTGESLASGIPLIFPNGPEHNRDEGENDVVTPKLSLAFDLTKDVLLYTIVAKGYRQGGFNPSSELTNGGPETFEPDVTWNYEIGAKTAWFDNRLVANAAVYYIDWRDLQVIPAFLPFQFRYVANVGKAHSKGGELELLIRPIKGLEISASGGLTHARLDVDTALAPEGSWLPRVPRRTAALTAQYRWPIGDELQGLIRGSVQSVGKSYSSLDNDPISLAPAYETGDLRVGVEGEKWSAYLYAKNIWDERGITEADLLASGLYSIIQPRSIGLTVRIRL